MSDFLDEAERLLIHSGLADRRGLSGLSDVQIREIEEAQGAPLPQEYRRFLARMGRRAGRFMVGSHFFYPEILQAKEFAEELLREDGEPFQLLPTDVVCLIHQGYFFFYLRGPDVDPPVYGYREGGDAELQDAHFSEFLLSLIRGEAAG